MLQAGGAEVTLAGFRRAKALPPGFGGISPIELGATRDGSFAQRLAAVAKAALSLGAKLRGVAEAGSHHRPQPRDAGARQARQGAVRGRYARRL